ncbi:MAG TPA: tetratricopeptide repeat protein [Thermoanaerobaculia bacterium]|jgi:tetratricopeptide (TPR) repeat protein|nr:tetratricopeptide repeat protein [Thermoanaerobaculia bacterium]
MEEIAESTWYILERRQPFSQSVLWTLQRHYFAARGVEAWRRGEVPHYITSNPAIANSYAEIVFAFLCDQDRLSAADAAKDEPLYICELGAGSGRFAFHFLSRLIGLCEQAGVAAESFRYVLTDQAASNLQFWRGHSRFERFFADGLLGVARLDINAPGEAALDLDGRTITAGSLGRPLVVIANYVFDSIPQDLFYLNGEECQQCVISLEVDADPGALDIAELLERVHCHYDRQTLTEPAYEEPWLQELLAGYQRALPNTHLLFPAAGLRCLQRLGALSKRGLLLLSADKGDHRLTALKGRPAPDLVRHGSFSLSVNYHAIKMFCERSGGLALFPISPYQSLSVNACLMVPEASGHVETLRAYQRQVQDFGPDDFFAITRHVCETIGQMALPEILAYLRLSHYDSHLFAKALPRLTELAAELDRDERRAVGQVIDRVWELYFPLGEELDLANAIARLLYEMDDYRRALDFFQRSLDGYGAATGTLANMASCHHMLGDNAAARTLLQSALEHDPGDAQVQELLLSISDA